MSNLFRSSPMFDSIEIIHITLCDNCEGACEQPAGDPDHALFCCLCAYASAPPEFLWEPCDACRQRRDSERCAEIGSEVK